MSNVVALPLPLPQREVRAATCGCGGQTFILVVDANGQPDFAYCTECQKRQLGVIWSWPENPKDAA